VSALNRREKDRGLFMPQPYKKSQFGEYSIEKIFNNGFYLDFRRINYLPYFADSVCYFYTI
jgi:hypothetical protein